MRIVLSGGGTAGHVYPALAVADRLLADGHDVTYYGTPTGLESRLVPEAGVTFRPLAASGFDRARPWTLITSSVGILRSAITAYLRFSSERPDVVVGFGGYVSIPVGLAASWRRVPLVLAEQNAVPGMTNRFLAKRASTICITYPETEPLVAGSAHRVVVTGNPVRESVVGGDRDKGRAALGVVDPTDVLLLVFGGSRGARHLNTAIAAASQRILNAAGGSVFIVHATGANEYETVRGQVDPAALEGGRYRVVPYIEDMGDVMAASDFAVCRAGATTIAELTAIGLGAILVPYPFATDDHQTKNAAAMVAAGAAVAFSDAELESDRFVDALVAILDDETARDTMSRASSELGRPHAAAALAEEIYGAATYAATGR